MEQLLEQVKGSEIAAIRIAPSLVGGSVELIHLFKHFSVPDNLKHQAPYIGIGVYGPEFAQLGLSVRCEGR